jgi:hypothetical protein
MRLRVKDIDFAQYQITVRDGKGQKDRITMLPERFANVTNGVVWNGSDSSGGKQAESEARGCGR